MNERAAQTSMISECNLNDDFYFGYHIERNNHIHASPWNIQAGWWDGERDKRIKRWQAPAITWDWEAFEQRENDMLLSFDLMAFFCFVFSSFRWSFSCASFVSHSLTFYNTHCECEILCCVCTQSSIEMLNGNRTPTFACLFTHMTIVDRFICETGHFVYCFALAGIFQSIHINFEFFFWCVNVMKIHGKAFDFGLEMSIMQIEWFECVALDKWLAISFISRESIINFDRRHFMSFNRAENYKLWIQCAPDHFNWLNLSRWM